MAPASSKLATNAAFARTIKTILRIIRSAASAAAIGGVAYYLLFLIIYKLKQRKKKGGFVPGPTPLPLLGNLLDVAKLTGPDGNPLVHRALQTLAKTYAKGGVFGLYLGAYYTVVITKPSVAEEAFCKNGRFTSDRAKNQSAGGDHVPSMYAFTRNGKGIAMSTGKYWRKVRTRLEVNISRKAIAEKNEAIIREEVESVCWLIRGLCEVRKPVMYNLTEQLKRESMNVSMRLLFSRRFAANPPQDFIDLQYFAEYFFRNLSSGNPSDMIPILRPFPNAFMKDFKKTIARRDAILEKIIDEGREDYKTRRKMKKFKDESDARNVLDLFLFDEEMGRLTKDQVLVCIWDILFAMTDTTATTMEWLIYILASYPKVQRKIHEELDRVIGPDRLPTLDDQNELPYLWAVVKEVLRFRLVSPVMAPHYASETFSLHDSQGVLYNIPRGTQIFLHGFAMAQDEELWDVDPKIFYPERWIDIERNADLDLHGKEKRRNVEAYKFVPFSMGPRTCPGYSFAKLSLFLQASTLVHCCEWHLSDEAKRSHFVDADGRLDLTENWGLTIMPRRYAKLGFIKSVLRPASRLAKPTDGDIDETNTFLDRTRQNVTIVSMKYITQDTLSLTCSLGDDTKSLGLPCGKHFKVFAPNPEGAVPGEWNGRKDPEFGKKEITRSYTPVSSATTPGHFDLIVKVYQRNESKRFPDGGKLSQYISSLSPGCSIAIKGPFGLVSYAGKSEFKVSRKTRRARHVGMLAGGSGITPHLQVLIAALDDDDDETEFSLIYANQTEEDILARTLLEDLANRHPTRFKLHYTVDKASEGWGYSVGFIDAEMIAQHLPPPSNDVLVLMCGPPPMIKFACKPNLEKLGYAKESQVMF